jgi:hypothetical protein
MAPRRFATTQNPGVGRLTCQEMRCKALVSLPTAVRSQFRLVKTALWSERISSTLTDYCRVCDAMVRFPMDELSPSVSTCGLIACD